MCRIGFYAYLQLMHAWFSAGVCAYILPFWMSNFLHFPFSKSAAEGFTAETCIKENCGLEKKFASKQNT